MTSVGVIGAGLIGGSICKSLRAAGASEVSVYSQSASTQAEAKADGFSVVASIADLVAVSDVVFVCVPLDAQVVVFRDVASAVSKNGRQGIIVTDVSSVKGVEARQAIELFAEVGAVFIPGHPMAGTEFSGFAASTDSMFQNATWVLCPESAHAHELATVMSLILDMGARVSVLDIGSHDEAVGAVSHLPYVVAASLANLVASQDSSELFMRLAAGSFRDGTRVAGSEPWLSASMATFNRSQVVSVIEELERHIHKMKTALLEGDDDAVLDFFQQARDARRRYEDIKAASQTHRVVWAQQDAVATLRRECSGGALVHSLHVLNGEWTVEIEGVSSHSL